MFLVAWLYNTIIAILYVIIILLCSLSDLPECQVPIAMRADVFDQMLVVALHPYCECRTAMVSVKMIENLTKSPETHVSIVREEVVEKMLKIQKTFDEQLSAQSSSEDRMEISVLKYVAIIGHFSTPFLSFPLRKILAPKIIIVICTVSSPSLSSFDSPSPTYSTIIFYHRFYTSTALAQIGLGSPYLLLDHIPFHLLQQILDLMSDTLGTVSPAELREYESEEKFDWGIFRPSFNYLYKPSPIEAVNTKEASVDVGDKSMIRDKLHISCCNVILHGLEFALGREIHLEVLIKEGLLDYVMCLPAVLPGECQPRARSLVNELGKHRQLQPPSLCTLAKAHIAKTFCGLQPVMEMKSIGEFLHLYFD